MTTLATPNTATYTVSSPADIIVITCGDQDNLLATWVGAAGISGRIRVCGSTETIGPWPLGTVITLTATRGECDWSVSGGGGDVSSVNGKTGAVVLDKADLSLGNVDNTADSAKPVSTAQATAIAARTPIAYTGVLPSSATGISNLTLANTSVIRQARAGGKRVIMAIVGDSMGAGYLTGGSGLVNARPNALAAKIASMLTARGIPATNNWAGGWPSRTAATPSDVAAYDPRLSFTGGAVVGFNSMGGYMTQMSAGTDRIFYQPGISGDTVDYYSVRGADGTSSHTLSLDGGTTTFQTITDTGTVGIARYSFAVAAGTLATRLTIKNGAAAAYPLMYQIRNAATPTIEVLNLGSVGATLQEHASAYGSGSTDPTSWNMRRAMEAILADSTALKLFVIQGGFNDFQNGRSTSQVQADLTTLVNTAKTGGADVIFLDYAAADPTAGSPPASGYAAYRTAIASTCASLGVVYVDTSARLNSYSDSNTRNLMGDQLHLNSAGMAYPAAMIVEAMTAPILN